MPDHRVAVTAVDFSDPQLVDDYLDLLDAYARDPMGGGVGLTDAVRTRLPIDLASNPAAHVLLARDASGAVGMATCFVGYSTFRALPLLNIHDIAVLPRARGRGVAKALFAAISALADRLNCCKLTLEVRTDTTVARQLYQRQGFVPASCSLFMEKPIGRRNADPSGELL
jgi:ribosomal protein S18 acetylase RimI-like enzyme